MNATLERFDIYSLIPERRKETSKYDYGRLLAVCGSNYYRGAAALSCGGALRCGAGIVTLASVEKVISAVASRYPECTFFPLIESNNGTVAYKNADKILEISKKYTALLVGCGLYVDSDTEKLVKRLISDTDIQIIIDADGINGLNNSVDMLKKAKKTPIITPHFGEMARLCGKPRIEIEKTPEATAISFASNFNCIVVLKSHRTYIASPDGRIAVNESCGNTGLSKGGSGDVLAGMIASFSAQGMSAFDAAKCGVYLHSEAADRCARRLSERGMLPSDILDDLCRLFLDIGR